MANPSSVNAAPSLFFLLIFSLAPIWKKVYKFTNLQEYKFTSLQIYNFTNCQVYKFTSQQIYKLTNLQV